MTEKACVAVPHQNHVTRLSASTSGTPGYRNRTYLPAKCLNEKLDTFRKEDKRITVVKVVKKMNGIHTRRRGIKRQVCLRVSQT